MNQSSNDPTLREHFSENEARSWIRHLEKIIENLEARLKKAGETNKKLAEKSTEHSRKAKRMEARANLFEERVIKLLNFITGKGLTPPEL